MGGTKCRPCCWWLSGAINRGRGSHATATEAEVQLFCVSEIAKQMKVNFRVANLSFAHIKKEPRERDSSISSTRLISDRSDGELVCKPDHTSS